MYTTIASFALVLIEQWLGHSSCEANSISGFFLNQARRCLGRVREDAVSAVDVNGVPVFFPTPPVSVAEADGSPIVARI